MIGIIPAAGRAARMLGLPKMLLPVPVPSRFASEPTGMTLIDRLHELMSTCAELMYVGTSAASFGFLQTHQWANTNVFHVTTNTMSETLLEARRRAGERQHDAVVFGMPDAYFDDTNIFVKMSLVLNDGALAAVGVFETRPEQRAKLGMVRTEGGQIKAVVDKPRRTALTQAWGVLAWQPEFWQYVRASDPHVGYALPRAINAGADVRAVPMRGGYYDCGTPDEYFDLICHLRGKRD